MSEDITDVSNLNIDCPYCGDLLQVNMDFDGVDSTPTNEVDSFACLEPTCDAEWDAEGVILRRSNWPFNSTPPADSCLEIPSNFNRDA